MLKPKPKSQKQPPPATGGELKPNRTGHRRSGFSPISPRPTGQPTPPPPADAMGSRCRVETRPTVPLRRRGGRWQRWAGWLLARLPELKATPKPKVKSNHPPPPAYPATGGELKPNRTGHRRSGFSPISPRPTGQPTPPPADAMGSRCRVETRPTVPLRRRGGRWQRRTGWLLARLPELKATTKPKVKSNHPPPPAYPSTGGELKPNRTGHQRRGITAPPQQHAPLAGA